MVCAQVLFTGQVDIVGEGVDDQFIFGLKRKEINHILNWQVIFMERSKIRSVGQCSQLETSVSLTSGFTPRVAVMGAKVVDPSLKMKQ